MPSSLVINMLNFFELVGVNALVQGSKFTVHVSPGDIASKPKSAISLNNRCFYTLAPLKMPSAY